MINCEYETLILIKKTVQRTPIELHLILITLPGSQAPKPVYKDELFLCTQNLKQKKKNEA